MNKFLKFLTISCMILLMPLTFATMLAGDVWGFIVCMTSILASFVILISSNT